MDEAFQNKDDLAGGTKEEPEISDSHSVCWKYFRCDPLYGWKAVAVRQFSPLVLLIKETGAQRLETACPGCASTE